MVVAGHFRTFETSRTAIGRLIAEAGIDSGRIALFYRSPDGHHVPVEHPDVDGSRAAPDVEARGAGRGAARGASLGAVIGAAAGVAATPLAGPLSPGIGAVLGAYAGSLAGALQGVSGPASFPGSSPPSGVLVHGGPIVAIQIADEGEHVVDLLLQSGAIGIVRCDGTIVGGEWMDYDPDAVGYTASQGGLPASPV